METTRTSHGKRGHARMALSSLFCMLLLLSQATAVQAQEKPQARRALPPGFPDLVSGLKAVKGCVGVETARTATGKNVIFAWFENKAAVLRWYYSEMHQGVIESFLSDATPQKPMQDVSDDVGPVMAIASITFSDKPHFEGIALPISQISIELYKPVTGGIFLGGRFAPDSLKVPGIRDLTPGKY